MPRGDATGPMGMGPMTGRGAGYCAGFGVPGYMNKFGGRGFGMGFGRGAGFGGRGARGGGFGFRNRFYATGVPGWAWAGSTMSAPYQKIDPATEKQALNNQAEILKTELDAIKKRLDELNTEAQK
ncbi:hypothetical protein ASZ90_005826 [hydrocarbon metagenome]|uniref:DUF5320 domain-containing protein n=1 Tax=hydrocarbon metagenome TaxID=938273 RepID=A0A0W8FUC4_9ZZZZ